eukprot:CAMPEP_0119404440 /NCGR_PEP_ID=MMETSP1334-20130426/143895_1 /TAXON_ID=127549 /ORGANISM="Calcidiscus leptoporus, Strain RCC1130" /LENGTH=485 /DNA_ID=CAMNT_0007428407 /DNA_START=15 /DNA_END=1469 /DNA_ORIENTATION=+
MGCRGSAADMGPTELPRQHAGGKGGGADPAAGSTELHASIGGDFGGRNFPEDACGPTDASEAMVQGWGAGRDAQAGRSADIGERAREGASLAYDAPMREQSCEASCRSADWRGRAELSSCGGMDCGGTARGGGMARSAGATNPPTESAFPIPVEAVGFVIGKGGDKIMSIRRESGARIDIDNDVLLDEGRARLVRIRAASQQACQIAQRLVNDAVRTCLARCGGGADGSGARSDGGYGMRSGCDEQRRHHGARADGKGPSGGDGRAPRGAGSGGDYERAEGCPRRYCREEQERGASAQGMDMCTLSDEQISEILTERDAARLHRDYAAADGIRDRLKAQGVIMDDKARTWSTSDGRFGSFPQQGGGRRFACPPPKTDGWRSERPPLERPPVGAHPNAPRSGPPHMRADRGSPREHGRFTPASRPEPGSAERGHERGPAYGRPPHSQRHVERGGFCDRRSGFDEKPGLGERHSDRSHAQGRGGFNE